MKKACIFDMNGVIINDEHYQIEAWKQLCINHKWKLTQEDITYHVVGVVEREVISYLMKRDATPEEVNLYSNERVDIAMDLYKDHLAMAEGLKEFLQELKTAEIPCAVATSSQKRYTNFIMDTLQIRAYFHTILTAEDIVRGKPNPEIYLKSAQMLQITPQNCVVFEDAITGIHAAKAAGMKVVALSTTNPAEMLQDADKVIASFKEVSVKDLNIM
jgi:HAD superfamily hydrolase (TIGR01509 family)